MRDIIHEMGHHMPESFLWHHIFLAALMAIAALDNGTAVETVFLFSLWDMGQCEILLKISYKKIQAGISFTLVYNQVLLYNALSGGLNFGPLKQYHS